MSNFIY